MKKVILIVVSVAIVGMVGWTVYDFVSEEPEEELGGTTISAPEEEEGEESESNSDSDSDSDSSGGVGFDIGDKPPDFELETLEGETEKLSDHEGERVIVNFWATWCPPCREEIPHFNKLYKNRDVEILAIDLEETEDNIEDVEEWVYDEFEMEFPVLRDKTSEVATEYQVMAYPTSYLIDSEGYIQFKAMGAMDYDDMIDRVDRMD